MSNHDEARRLSDDRRRLIEQERSLLNSIKPGQQKSGEQVQALERLAGDIAAAEDRLRNIADQERRDRDGAELAELTGQVFGSDHAVDRSADQLRNFLAGQGPAELSVDIRAAAKEREMLRSGADWHEIRNAITWDTGSMASAVPTSMARTLYQFLEEEIAAFRIGSTRIDTVSGENIDFPKLASHGVATQVAGQGTQFAGTDPTFAKLTLGANKYGELVVVANEVLTDAAFDVSGFLGGNIGRALGRLVDGDLVVEGGSITHGLIGSGVTPTTAGLGSVNTGGTLTTTVGLDPTWLIDVIHGVPDSYRNRGAWLFNDSAAADIRKLRDGAGGTEGAFLWEPSRARGLVNGQPDTLLGFPVFTDPNIASIASNNLIGAFGDFSTYYTRSVQGVQIDLSTERYFDTDQTAVRGRMRVDGGYIDTNGVKLIKNNV